MKILRKLREKRSDLIGQIINDWSVVKELPSDGRGVHYECRCECGTLQRIRGSSLRLNKSRSCRKCQNFKRDARERRKLETKF